MNCRFTKVGNEFCDQTRGIQFMTMISRIIASITLTLVLFGGMSSLARADQSERVPSLSELKGLTGAKLSASDIKGKIVVFQFFASWCVGCEKTMEDMIAMIKTNPNVVYVPVSVDEDIKSAKSFFVNKSAAVKALEGISFVDTSTEFAARLNVKAVPTVIIANGDGAVIARNAGHPNKERFAEFQASLSQAPKSSVLGATH